MISKDQAQILATLACEARPRGAKRWDPAGVVAAIAKVRHLPLGEVTAATMKAAADRTFETPGAISNTTTSCWRPDPTPVNPPTDAPDPSRTCTVCHRSRYECERRAATNGHTFLAEADHVRSDPETVRARVAEIKKMVHGFGRLPDDVANMPIPEPDEDPLLTYLDDHRRGA